MIFIESILSTQIGLEESDLNDMMRMAIQMGIENVNTEYIFLIAEII